MKNYKDYPRVYIGGSDVSALTVATFGEKGIEAHVLKFGNDGEYFAYIVDGDCTIPDHYAMVLHVAPYTIAFHGQDGAVTQGTPSGWVKVYDDSKLQYSANFTQGMNIYRAGELGCIIQLL